MEPALAVSEIFRSIQGETSRAGLPCSFVRTVGCNLHCAYCDTEYARDGDGIRLTVPEIVAEVDAHGTRLACITGGEPMAQAQGVAALAGALLAGGRTVLVETNGSLDLSPLPADVVRIMDVKCPGSGESGTTLPANVAALRPIDEVKFVLSGRVDFDWALAYVREHRLDDGPHILMAPVHGRLAASDLAEWMLAAGLQARLQLQLHKIIWPDRDRGV